MTTTLQTRFKAEWIKKQRIEDGREWDPDEDEYGVSYHQTREAAAAAAIEASKNAHQCEWIIVTEEKYVRGEWVEQERWTGDWDGLSV